MRNDRRLHGSAGFSIPQLGLGVWRISDAEVGTVVEHALKLGYRLIDTAAIYENERGIGRVLQQELVPREHVFITTKLWKDRMGYDGALRAIDESLSRLQQAYVDLFLIHWPLPQLNQFVPTWRALIRIKESGRARAIGVSNFTVPLLERIIGETGVVPAVNQIELHPYLQQSELRAFHHRHGIITQSWSPLGKGKVLDNAALVRIAAKHQRTPAQVLIRWQVELGLATIPKSAHPYRLADNLNVYDFTLDDGDLKAIESLDRGTRMGPHPDHFA